MIPGICFAIKIHLGSNQIAIPGGIHKTCMKMFPQTVFNKKVDMTNVQTQISDRKI